MRRAHCGGDRAGTGRGDAASAHGIQPNARRIEGAVGVVRAGPCAARGDAIRSCAGGGDPHVAYCNDLAARHVDGGARRGANAQSALEFHRTASDPDAPAAAAHSRHGNIDGPMEDVGAYPAVPESIGVHAAEGRCAEDFQVAPIVLHCGRPAAPRGRQVAVDDKSRSFPRSIGAR